MNLTNEMELPAPFVRFAVSRMSTVPPQHLSVTRLIGPAWLRALQIRHWDEIEQDVSDMVWALFGTSVHDLLERFSSESELVEERIQIELDGQIISGQPDVLAIDSGVLSDWKVSSAWSIVLGTKPEWEAQLNLYAYGLRQAGRNVTAIQNVVFIRDWSRTQALRSADYPQAMVQVVPLDLWPQAKVEAFIRERLAAHADPKPCSDVERWTRKGTWAVMKEGRKTAVRVFEDEKQAEELAAQDEKYRVEHRPGAEVRCQSYCPVSQFCEEWKKGGSDESEA